MELRFTGAIWYWRGPSPYHFLTVPDEHSAYLHAVSPLLRPGSDAGVDRLDALVRSKLAGHPALPGRRPTGRIVDAVGPQRVRIVAGSKASWIPSPIRLADSTITSSASPGK
jgi:hypothetical protein